MECAWPCIPEATVTLTVKPKLPICSFVLTAPVLVPIFDSRQLFNPRHSCWQLCYLEAFSPDTDDCGACN